MITPLPGCTPTKAGSATLPFFGIDPVLLDGSGKELKSTEAEGILCIRKPWPGMLRTCWNDHDRFLNTYMTAFKGYYFTGDGARRDKDGYYWITGRVDDVINVSGHRIGSADIEFALGHHSGVAESAVIGVPHDIKGQALFAYVTLKEGYPQSETTVTELTMTVQQAVGAFARPDHILVTAALPKTRSGKIMRRILRKIATGESDSIGDTSTLADPQVVPELIAAVAELFASKKK